MNPLEINIWINIRAAALIIYITKLQKQLL